MATAQCKSLGGARSSWRSCPSLTACARAPSWLAGTLLSALPVLRGCVHCVVVSPGTESAQYVLVQEGRLQCVSSAHQMGRMVKLEQA